MNTSEKLFAAMSANPNNWHLRDMKTIAKRHSITWKKKGSHCIFERPGGDRLSVPDHGVIKPVYVKEFILFVKGCRHG
ncbi:MAG TPA: hypothetical protein VFX55_13420 [Duganella sp.]|nr:hypothetical protein [Duganella sp.]